METATGALNVRWIKTGTQYMLGHTQQEPHFYGIWARSNGPEPSARFPFTEHGKNEAMAAFLAVEPDAADVTLDGEITASATPWALSAAAPAPVGRYPVPRSQSSPVRASW